MRIFFYTLLTLGCLVFCSSCAEVFGPTNHHHIVSPNKKGSLQLNGGFYDTYDKGEVKEYPAPLRRFSYGIQVGYSPVERLGVIANYFRPNYFFRSNVGQLTPRGGLIVSSLSPGQVDTTIAYFGQLADVAVGTYWKKSFDGYHLEEINKFFFDQDNEWLFDVYAGVGKGELLSNYSFIGNKEVNFNLYYIQGGVHWKNGKVKLDLVQRIAGTSFKKIDFQGNLFKDDLELGKELNEKILDLASITSFRLGIGPEYGKLYVEGNWTSYSGGIKRFYFNGQRFNVGLLLELDTCFRLLRKK